MEIAGSVVLLTGAASGLGKALAVELLSQQAKVVALDRDLEKLEALSREHPQLVTLGCDVSKPEQVETAVAKAIEACGRLDVLVNNAGIVRNELLVNLVAPEDKKHSLSLWHEVISANLSSVFYMTRVVADHLVNARRPGLIVNISSIAAGGNAGQTAYSASKAGVIGMTKTWAKELGPLGIRAVAIAPGFVNTEMTKLSVKENVLANLAKSTACRRLGRPEEIVSAVLFVMRNDYYNGKTLEVDGGLFF